MQGIGGIMSMQGEPDGEPMKVAVAIADIVAGQFAELAILAALLRRGRDRHRARRSRCRCSTRRWPGSRTAAATG